MGFFVLEPLHINRPSRSAPGSPLQLVELVMGGRKTPAETAICDQWPKKMSDGFTVLLLSPPPPHLLPLTPKKARKPGHFKASCLAPVPEARPGKWKKGWFTLSAILPKCPVLGATPGSAASPSPPSGSFPETSHSPSIGPAFCFFIWGHGEMEGMKGMVSSPGQSQLSSLMPVTWLPQPLNEAPVVQTQWLQMAKSKRERLMCGRCNDLENKCLETVSVMPHGFIWYGFPPHSSQTPLPDFCWMLLKTALMGEQTFWPLSQAFSVSGIRFAEKRFRGNAGVSLCFVFTCGSPTTAPSPHSPTP